MLTYDLTKANMPLYLYIYECIKQDIAAGRLKMNDKMPSKRALAANLGVSTITIENAYDQLIGEGYMYAIPKKGYYISDLSEMKNACAPLSKSLHIIKKRPKDEITFDFSSNRTESADFPFPTWAKLVRETMSQKEKQLLEVSPCEGVRELRVAIAEHLSSFRGMAVDPDQIIVGAGTEYLYSLLIKLIGTDKLYCIENPGYKKLMRIYDSNHANCTFIGMDKDGIRIDDLKKSGADIVHISPTHHFPTGITMPITRRCELLAWANEKDGRYIIEDDYDSEFRIKGKPIPSLQSIDLAEKVIYMNTFSKSLTATIRISYMVLPRHLANLFFEKLSFYSNTVSSFEQYTLAAFISRGYFEKHINRMRLRYGRKRAKVLESIRKCFPGDMCRVIENDSGLHFLLELKTNLSDSEVKRRLMDRGIRIETITDYYIDKETRNQHRFILNYSGIDMEGLDNALREIGNIIE